MIYIISHIVQRIIPIILTSNSASPTQLSNHILPTTNLIPKPIALILLDQSPHLPTRPAVQHVHAPLAPERVYRALVPRVRRALDHRRPHLLPPFPPVPSVTVVQPLQPFDEMLPFFQEHVPLTGIQKDILRKARGEDLVGREGGGGVGRGAVRVAGEVGVVEEGGEEGGEGFLGVGGGEAAVGAGEDEVEDGVP